MKLIPGCHWEGDIIDFDLAGYSCLVKLLKRSLRHLTEACLANLLMKDITKVRRKRSQGGNVKNRHNGRWEISSVVFLFFFRVRFAQSGFSFCRLLVEVSLHSDAFSLS